METASVKPLDEQLEAVREKGVPCPFCDTDVPWNLGEKTRGEILKTISQGGVHEKFVMCDKDECPSAESGEQFLRRIFVSHMSPGGLIMATFTPQQVIAQLDNVRSQCIDLREKLAAVPSPGEDASAVAELRRQLSEKTQQALDQFARGNEERARAAEKLGDVEGRLDTSQGLLQRLFEKLGIEWPPGGIINDQSMEAIMDALKALRSDSRKLGELNREVQVLHDICELTGFTQGQLLERAQEAVRKRDAAGQRAVSRPAGSEEVTQVTRQRLDAIDPSAESSLQSKMRHAQRVLPFYRFLSGVNTGIVEVGQFFSRLGIRRGNRPKK